MTIHDFYENYPEEDITLVKIESTGKEIRLDLRVSVFMEYIANGLRSSFDSMPVHRFIFHQEGETYLLTEPLKITSYLLKEDGIHLQVGERNILLTDNAIEIKPYIQ